MNISQVYQHYQVPPNVRDHMLSTGVVLEFIRDHWIGEPTIDWQVAMKAILMHDLGNLIKFKRPFIGVLEDDGEYWQKIQQELITKYGSVASQATLEMVRDLDLGEEGENIISLLSEMSQIAKSKPGDELRLEARLLEFVDCVVTPRGIESFETRIADLAKRYNKPDPIWQETFRENARIVQKHVAFDVMSDLGKMFDAVVLESAKKRLAETIL